MAKMTRYEMVEKLTGLYESMHIQLDGKTYEVISILRFPDMKLCRHEVALLEVGKPATYEVPGRFLNAGQMIQMSNVRHLTWYAQPMYLNWEIVAA